MHKITEERFWSKVAKSDGCWLWIGWCFSNGYGDFRTSGSTNRRHLLAHRVAYEFANGPIPEGMMALHRCDVRNCVNPGHLFLGTQADNIHDCVNKKRQGNHSPHNPAKGSNHYKAMFIEEQVIEIRRIYAVGGVGQSELARRYNTTQGTIQKIVNGSRWAHVPILDYGKRTNKPYRQPAGETHGRHKITTEQAKAVYFAEGTQQAIAQTYGICRSTVSLIKSGKLWTTVTQGHANTP